MGGFQETPVLLKTLCKIVCTDRHIDFFFSGGQDHLSDSQKNSKHL